MVFRTYRDLAILVASFSTANLFLALTMKQPESKELLHDYPLFLGLNLFFIALCGSIALIRQTLEMLRKHTLSRSKSIAIVLIWLAVSLPVGGQWSWYLRPFFGISALGGVKSFCLGHTPDFRGDSNFFEAVYHLFDPPR